MKVVFLCLILFFIGGAWGCDTVQLSFDLCNADLNCRSKLFIDMNGNDIDVFRYLLNQIITYHRLGNKLDDYICNSTLVNSSITQNQQVLWVVIMTNYDRFCDHINEYFDGFLHKCMCRPDKVCIHENPNEKLFGYSSEQLYTWGLLLLIVMVAGTNLHAIRIVVRWLTDVYKALLQLGVSLPSPVESMKKQR